jgi:hypothetical protein
VKALVILLSLALPAVGVWGFFHFEPRTLELSPTAKVPIVELTSPVPKVIPEGMAFVATVATFDEELYAYFNYDYLKSRSAVGPAEVILTHTLVDGESRFPLLIWVPDGMAAAIPLLESLQRQNYIPAYDWRWVGWEQLQTWRRQSFVFSAAYNFPVRRRMEQLTATQKHEIVKRIVVFKSRTDPRVRKGLQPVPPTLTDSQAQQLASDVLTVADFFWLPLEFFLGIGAMENNYMDVDGDLQHAVWKSRAQEGDIVLRRRNGRVLVRNHASGVWQITRETLRYAHKLYRRGSWDYSLLPAHLRPPEKLDFNSLEAAHLTTYAGVLFRDLIDRFDGDVAKAVGAYNGGPGNPNMGYEKGVRMVANYARRMLEQAAQLNGESVADMQFLAPGIE